MEMFIKGWGGTKKRKPAWPERHSVGDGHAALGIYPHLQMPTHFQTLDSSSDS